MRTISFNKQNHTCLYCKKNKVRRWNDKCESCKKKRTQNRRLGAIVANRQPAAVIKTDDGREIFVDKFGKEVKDHNYDLKNDPRGYKTTGRSRTNTII